MILRIVLTSFIAASFACFQAAAQTISRVGFPSTRIEINAASVEGATVTDVSLSQIDVLPSSGEKERGNLIVFYDPTNHLYLWTLQFPRDSFDMLETQTDLESGKKMVFASPDGLYLFVMANTLSILKGENHAKSLGDAENLALDAIRRGFTALDHGGFNRGYTHTPVGAKISKSFACDPDPMYRTDCEFGIKKFVSIARQGENWKLVVRNRWDQEIILDSNFGLVSTRPLP